jgi:hypothetical protein
MHIPHFGLWSHGHLESIQPWRHPSVFRGTGRASLETLGKRLLLWLHLPDVENRDASAKVKSPVMPKNESTGFNSVLS